MDRYSLAGPLLRLLGAESAHAASLWALRLGLAAGRPAADDPILATRVWGRRFPNPLGMAAGFDKDAVAIGPALGLGFGFVEVGTVTPAAQAGNPRPRIFRLAQDAAVINRIGFAGAGSAVVARRLARWRALGEPGIVGVNLGKNRDSEDAAADYAAVAAAVAAYADYLVVNVSSPNTPGLRALQGREALAAVLAAVRAALGQAGLAGQVPPLLVKIAPDLTAADREDIAALAVERGLDGLIVSNTTIARPPELRGRHRDEAGGLSGRPLFAPATALLAELYRLTGGRVPIVGVGGVGSAAEAYAKLRAGASLVQLYTALIYRGPGLVARIKHGLADLLRRDGFTSPAEATGADQR